MNRDEFFAMNAAEAAAEMNKMIEAGKTEQEIYEEIGIAKGDMMKAQIFFVKGQFMARGWGGYTSTKRTGNEAGDTGIGVGGGDASKGYSGAVQ